MSLFEFAAVASALLTLRAFLSEGQECASVCRSVGRLHVIHENAVAAYYPAILVARCKRGAGKGAAVQLVAAWMGSKFVSREELRISLSDSKTEQNPVLLV